MIDERFSQLVKFLSGPHSNAWLKLGSLDVYVRKSRHMVQAKLVSTLDIANVKQARTKPMLHFDELSNEAVRLLSSDPVLRGNISGIYVENVLNSKLAIKLEELGYLKIPAHGDLASLPCYYLTIENNIS